jgi:hypothetical protein
MSIGNGMGTASCTKGNVQVEVTYTLSSTVTPPFYLPVIGTKNRQTVTGTVWIR